MDWARARALLIAAFLLLNAWLVYQQFVPRVSPSAPPAALSGSQMKEVRDRLGQAGISLTATVPRETPSLALLRVARPTVGLGRDAGESYDANAEPNLINGTDDVSADGKTGAILYHYPPGKRQIELDAGIARGEAEDFLRVRGFFRPDSRYLQTKRAGEERYTVEFVQVYSNLPVYSSSLRVTVIPEGVVEVRDQWLTPVGSAGPSRRVLPASEALLRLAGHLQRGASPLKRELTAIELGYYGKSYAESRQWDLVPVWRMLFSDDVFYYVNAFTGGLEQ